MRPLPDVFSSRVGGNNDHLTSPHLSRCPLTQPSSKLKTRLPITSVNWIRRFVCPSLYRFVAVTCDHRSAQLSKYPVAHQFEQKTQVPKAWAFIGAVALVFFSLFVNILAHPISNLVGWALPAYLSVKAIESPGHEDDVQWLTYWVTFAVRWNCSSSASHVMTMLRQTFTFIESVALRMVLYYLPFYFVFKTIFILWLHLPATKVLTPLAWMEPHSHSLP